MDIEKVWHKAVKDTEIEKSCLTYLNSASSTMLHYIMLSESLLDNSDTVVRRGRIEITKPLVYLPEHNPVFKGFEFSDGDICDSSVLTFLLLRGVNLPSLKYHNTVYSLDVESLSLSESVKKHKQHLQKLEDVKTGVIIGPDDCWHFSLLIYVAALAAKSAPNDIRNFLEDLKRKSKDR
ncbi:MAG: hypothetical protein PHQ54_02200 [Candidatus Omnitrophica bacterium]|nr:hypothetical protein [Candidatus Omnitrophota bacterium]